MRPLPSGGRPRRRPRSLGAAGAAGWALLATIALSSIVPAGAARSAGPSAPPTVPYLPAYAGVSWVHLHRPNASVPGPRLNAGLADDPAAGGVVLFGGCGPTLCPMNDTWWYSAGLWTNLTPTLAVSPTGRSDAAMAYDPALAGVVLFGGCGPNGTSLGDSWLFADARWTELDPASSPPALCGAAAATAPSGAGIDLFGGAAGNGSLDGTLWGFASGNWSSLPAGPNGTPAARENGSLALAPGNGSLVLFGGRAADGSMLAGTWRYGPRGWSTMPPAAGGEPPARADGALVPLPPLGGDLLFGGENANGLLNDSWLLGPNGWTNLTGALSRHPNGRVGAASAFDTADNYALLEGGRLGPTGARNDSWAFVLPLSARVVVPEGPVLPSALVGFSANVSGGLPPYHYNWSFGTGGSPVHEVAPYYAYASPGEYLVNVTVVDARGVAVGASRVVTVALPTLAAALRIDPADATPGTDVGFDAVVTGGTPPLAAVFQGLPAGCSSGNALNFSCRVDAPGQYSVQLSVTDARGTEANASALLIVGAAAVAPLTAGPSAGELAFQRWGWVLVPPLAAAVVLAGYSAYVTYSLPTSVATLPTRPDCYVPPEWSETPAEFRREAAAPPAPGSDEAPTAPPP